MPRILLPLFLLILGGSAVSQSWPTHRHDNHRSGYTRSKLNTGKLEAAWTWQSPQPPSPAWGGPAKWDAYRNLRGLASMRNFDPVFHTVSSGGAVYFGSSIDDTLRRLDLRTGKVEWEFVAGGPIRLAPSLSMGRLYFGCDDGYAYAIHASSGRLAWKSRPQPDPRQVLNDGRLISVWPCRSGVLVEKGTAYFALSMLPWRPSYLCAVNAVNGKPEGPRRWKRKFNGMSMEGALLASKSRIVVPQGRVSPLLFKRSDGKVAGALKGGGGSFAIITNKNEVMHGPGNKTGWITSSEAETRTQIATYRDGRSIVVQGKRAYLLTASTLKCIDRKTQKLLWEIPCDCPHELIMARDVLIAGGRDKVSAFGAKDGKHLWTGSVRGRAHGLVVADGALIVSTDEGEVTCFRAGRSRRSDLAASRSRGTNEGLGQTPKPVNDMVIEKGLRGRWLARNDLMSGQVLRDMAGAHDGRVVGAGRLREVGGAQALVMEGSTSIRVADDHTTAGLPVERITAEAWVRVDQPLPYGGIVSAVRDNGGDETGWVLGYSGNRFCFALRGSEGPGRLTYLKAGKPFELKSWHHVVGTYDGISLSIWVDGELGSRSTAQKGPIVYPPKTWFELGSYHDTDEHFPMSGMFHEACVWDRVLGDEEIASRYAAKKNTFPKPTRIGVGPWVRFLSPETAEVRWETLESCRSVLELSLGGQSRKFVADSRTGKGHRVVLDNLRHDVIYDYVIHQSTKQGQNLTTPTFELDTYFNYSNAIASERDAPFKDRNDWDPAMTAARSLLARSNVRSGLALVVGCGEGHLAAALTHHADLHVLGVDTDKAAIRRGQRQLLDAGIYGSSVTLRTVPKSSTLPLPGGWVNLLVVAKGELDEKEARRLICPGGIAILGQKTITRPAMAGSGEWSHQYGRANNSAFGGESLGGNGNTAPLIEQWVGRPGPRAQPDRSGRKPSPLSVDGRLYVQGLNRMLGLDAFNGMILWSLEIPPLVRMNIPRDCSNWCADSDHVWVAIRDRCWQIRGDTGEVVKLHKVLEGDVEGWAWDWGYVARTGDLLLGTAVKSETTYSDFWGGGGAGWYDATSGPVTQKVCSDRIFALDRKTGSTVWSRSNGVIINSTITVADGRTHFVECRNQQVKDSRTRRVGMPELWSDQFLVALDTKSGEVIHEVPLGITPGVVVLYMAAAEGKLAMVSSAAGNYNVYVHDAKTGTAIWNSTFPWLNGKGDHGTHMSRPAIVNGRLFVRPRVFDLKSGTVEELIMPGGGCGTYALTSSAVIYRSGNVTFWDHKSGAISSWHRLRPGCWLSTIPASGMLLSPEAGGGCSCGNWLETSIAFKPGTED